MDLVQLQMSQVKKSLIFVKLVSIVVIVLFFSCAIKTNAATLSFSTGQGYSVGQTFPVQVIVSTANGEAINAVSANITFNSSQLQLVSISQTSSIISMWASPPTFSNKTGSADLEGIIPNPGFTGQNGNVAVLNFKVLSAGSTQLSFSQASVLANDGLGTNVLTSAPSKSIYIGAGAALNATTNDQVPPGAPSAPVIISTTNPDPTKWYATSSPSFSWKVPSDVTAIRLQYDTSPIATPSILYSPAISSKTLSNVPDGVYYLHAQFKNVSGWGAIAHFKFSIDTTPPAPFQIIESHPGNVNDPRPILLFNTTDSLSGMDHYNIKVGDLAFQTIDTATVASNPYTPPNQTPGNKTIVINAYDKAGNETTESTTIDIQSIDPPVIDNYQSEMQQGDFLRIQGHTYPNVVVTITVKDPSGVENSDTTSTNSDGKFNIAWSRQLNPGLYTFTATVTNGNGATSLPSNPDTLVVNTRTVLWISSLIINYLSISMLIIIVIAVLVAMFMYAYYHLKRLRHRIVKDISKVESVVHTELQELADDLAKNIELLNIASTKRQLTKEEKVIVGSLKLHIESLEKHIDDSLEKVRKEAK
jgi:hypothetical protein